MIYYKICINPMKIQIFFRNVSIYIFHHPLKLTPQYQEGLPDFVPPPWQNYCVYDRKVYIQLKKVLIFFSKKGFLRGSTMLPRGGGTNTQILSYAPVIVKKDNFVILLLNPDTLCQVCTIITVQNFCPLRPALYHIRKFFLK